MTFGILALGFPVSEVLEGFAAFGGSQSHFLPYSLFFPILMHSLGDVWHPGPGGSLFRRFWRVLQPLGAHSLTFFPILPYLNAFLRWRLASWPWGFPVSEVFGGFCSLWGLTVSLSSLFFPILMHSLGGRLASWPWGSLFRRFLEGFAAFGGSQSHFLPYSSLS